MAANSLKMKHCINYSLILALSFYVVVDLYVRTRMGSCNPQEKSPDTKISDICSTREGHYETTSRSHVDPNPWNQMKWMGEAANCKVKGQSIEKLDDANDFRRGFALKFTADVEDKTHLLPWLLGSKTPELGSRRRRVFIDLGANRFASSVMWFLRFYPCDFTEVHAFEIDSRQWRPPKKKFDERANTLDAPRSNPVKVNSTPGVPSWMMERVKVYFRLVSDKDDPGTNSVDITRFIKEQLRLTPDDTVVVKMDIEGAEWPILRKWMEDPLMPLIVDELFAEVHYASPSMSVYGWDAFAPVTRDDASRLIADLRWRGFYAHFWP